jgi:hypothetical protein
MNTVEIFKNFQEIGVRFELAGDGFNVFASPGIVTLEMRQLLKELKTEIVGLLRESQIDDAELAWRIEAMRQQLPEHGKPFPTLFARQEISPKLGDGFSCGGKLREFESGYCCGLCSRTKSILLEVA